MSIKESIQQNLKQLHMKEFSSLDYALTHLRDSDLEKFIQDSTSKLKGDEKVRAMAFLYARRADLIALKNGLGK